MLVKNNAITLKLTLQFNLRWLKSCLQKEEEINWTVIDYIRPGN